MLSYFVYNGDGELHGVDERAPIARDLVPVVKATGSCRVECRDDVEGNVWEQSYAPEDREFPKSPFILPGEIRLSGTIIHNLELLEKMNPHATFRTKR